MNRTEAETLRWSRRIVADNDPQRADRGNPELRSRQRHTFGNSGQSRQITPQIADVTSPGNMIATGTAVPTPSGTATPKRFAEVARRRQSRSYERKGQRGIGAGHVEFGLQRG